MMINTFNSIVIVFASILVISVWFFDMGVIQKIIVSLINIATICSAIYFIKKNDALHAVSETKDVKRGKDE